MEHTNSQANYVIDWEDEEFSIFDFSPDIIKAVLEAIIREKPEFKKASLANLKDNREFRQLFEKYVNSPSLKAETVKKIKSVIPRLDNNFALITDKAYKHALSPYKNSYAYIQQLDEDFFQQLEFNAENGTMHIKGNLLETITLQNAKTRSNLKELDLPLLRSLYTIIYSYADKIDTRTVTIYLPTLTKHLGVNIRGDKPNDMFAKIKAFDNVIGVLADGSFYRLLTFLEYDKQTNCITFGSPYMNKILRTLQEANTVILRKGMGYIKPHHSFLIHGAISNERNKSAVEIVCIIVALLHQRGDEKNQKEDVTADKLKYVISKTIKNEFDNSYSDIADAERAFTTSHKKISELIKEIPILNESLNKPTIDRKTGLPKPKTAREKNTVLRNAFSKAYMLLREKTDIYKYYDNLKITETIPTISTVDQVIEITHSGINRNYKKMW